MTSTDNVSTPNLRIATQKKKKKKDGLQLQNCESSVFFTHPSKSETLTQSAGTPRLWAAQANIHTDASETHSREKRKRYANKSRASAPRWNRCTCCRFAVLSFFLSFFFFVTTSFQPGQLFLPQC